MFHFFAKCFFFLKKNPLYLSYLLLRKFIRYARYYQYKYIYVFFPLSKFLSGKVHDAAFTLRKQKLIFAPFCERYFSICYRNSIIAKSDQILDHKFDLLGSGSINLGADIDWGKDFKSQFSWNNQYFLFYNYHHINKNNDVKIPWELSRHQYLITLAQAYKFTKDIKYLDKINYFLQDWCIKNPFAFSINWACTMDVALRAVSWIVVFDLLREEDAFFCDAAQTSSWLYHLYLHGIFIIENLEKYDINGNHYLSNAAGLYFIAIFFSKVMDTKKWLALSQKILEEEIHTQVYPDGANYEGSIPYHRLVTEIFTYCYLLGNNTQYPLSISYRNKLQKMMHFICQYMKPDANCPVIGDQDNGRFIILGCENINNHYYLLAIAAEIFDKNFYRFIDTLYEDAIWLFTPQFQDDSLFGSASYKSQYFKDSHYIILRNAQDYVFIESSLLGLANHGGHGHNDFGSFELSLRSIPIIIDSGCFVYTANYKERNNFRSTKYHNIPVVNNVELNRFTSPYNLWELRHDATHLQHKVVIGNDQDTVYLSHNGYQKICKNFISTREFHFEKKQSQLSIIDRFVNLKNIHSLSIPLHFHHEIEVEQIATNTYALISPRSQFYLQLASSTTWKAEKRYCDIAYSYGKLQKSTMLIFKLDIANDDIDFQTKIN